MQQSRLFKPNSKSILFIITCAFLGFIFSYFILRSHYIEPQLPTELFISKEASNSNIDTLALPIIPSPRIPSTSNKPTNKECVISSIDLLFQQNPFLLIWSMLIMVMMTIVSGVCPFFIWQLNVIGNRFLISKHEQILAVVGSLILISFISILPATLNFYAPRLMVEHLHILFSQKWIIPLFVILPLILLYPVFHSILIIGPASDKISFSITDKKSIENAANHLNYLNKVLQNALQVLAAFVVISILLSSSMRESLKAIFTITNLNLLPKEINYAYGLYFSLFLGLIYFPVSIYLNYRFNEFREALLNDNDLNLVDNGKWLDNLISRLNTDKSILENLKLALTIVSPLITSLLPEQLHF